MTPTEIMLLGAAFLGVSIVYSSVGHGGASGYLMVMGLAGLAPEVMRPTALTLNLVVAGLGVVRFARVGGFRWRTLWPFLVTSPLFAFIGGAVRVDASAYRVIVGIVLVFAAGMIWWRSMGRREEPEGRPVPVVAGVACGAAIGFLSGIVGVGGGIFLSPVLLLAGWASARLTAGVSAAFILANSAMGLIGFCVGHGLPSINPGVTGVFAGAVLTGGLIGTWLGTRRYGHVAIRRVLALVLLVAGVKMAATSGKSAEPATNEARPASMPVSNGEGGTDVQDV